MAHKWTADDLCFVAQPLKWLSMKEPHEEGECGWHMWLKKVLKRRNRLVLYVGSEANMMVPDGLHKLFNG
jgi:hypothetical protein